MEGPSGPVSDGPNQAPPLVIWGTGAMGGSIGGALVRAGVNVLFVDRASDHVKAMNDHGLRITGPVSEFVTPVQAMEPEGIRGRFPLIFLCVKSLSMQLYPVILFSLSLMATMCEWTQHHSPLLFFNLYS